jgi:copper transport protein
VAGVGRRCAAVVVVVLTLGMWSVVSAPTASAHATLLASTPPSGYAVATAPTEVTLDFDEAVSIDATPLTLSDTAGHPVALGPEALTLQGRRLTAPITGPIPLGGYRAQWQVTADDGDPITGVVTFTVGAGPAPGAVAGGGSTLDAPVVIVARWVLFAALALALGGAVGDLLARRVAGDVLARRVAGEVRARGTDLDRPPPLLVVGGVAGALAVAVLAADQVGLDPSRLLTSRPGQILAVELAGFALTTVLAVITRTRAAATGTRRTSSVSASLLAVTPLAAVVAAEGLRAHPHASSPVLGTVLTVVHLLTAAVWIGSLVQVLRVARAWRGHRGPTRLLVYGYARLALVLVLVVTATGTAAAILVLPSPTALPTSTYGRILLGKLAAVGAALALALLARRRLWQSVRRPALAPLSRVARSEPLAVAVVLALTAVLVTAGPPAAVTAALPAPPPPVGLVVPAGTLAGQVTVLAAASQARLLLRLGVPGADAMGADTAGTADTSSTQGPVPDYQVGAELTVTGRSPQAVTVQGCGPGCFTAPADWQPGTNHLHLDISAGRWHAGAAELDVPWPPSSGTDQLAGVVAAMRSAGPVMVHEAVTSDYDGNPPGTDYVLRLSGDEFVTTEPYTTGGGTPVLLGDAAGVTHLRMSFPQGYVLDLIADKDGRIVHEVSVTPNHLIIRTFDYLPAPS